MRRAPAGQQGYVLVLVLGMLALGAFVALRLSDRVDQLRSGARGFSELAEARAQAAGAQAAALYWISTRPLQPMGHGEPSGGVLREDGRWYRLPGDGGHVSVQDVRGLLSINALNRPVITQLLIGEGLQRQQADAFMDVLEDYVDADDLKRLNGAEKEDYRRMNLPPPRNDWLMSVRELGNMPLWRDDPARLERLESVLHVGISTQFNPNTASPKVLAAMFSGASPDQLKMIEALRRADLLLNGRSATLATGLPMNADEFIFVPGFDSRITAWAPGLPRAIEYNVRLTPAAPEGPWTVLEQHQTPSPKPTDEFRAAPVFPIKLVARP